MGWQGAAQICPQNVQVGCLSARGFDFFCHLCITSPHMVKVAVCYYDLVGESQWRQSRLFGDA